MVCTGINYHGLDTGTMKSFENEIISRDKLREEFPEDREVRMTFHYERTKCSKPRGKGRATHMKATSTRQKSKWMWLR